MPGGVQEHSDTHVSTGCSSLDSLLGGGWERGVVSQVYGVPGSGKTNVALQSSVEAIEEDGTVVYVDTEGLSLERFRQIAGSDYEEVARDFIVKQVYSFEEQAVAVRDVENLAGEADLVVLDSATGLYRVEPEEEEGEDSPIRRLTRQVTHLTGLARRYDLAVLLTNQVYTRVEDDSIRPLGGRMLEHWTKAIVELEKLEGERRRASVRKHRSMAEGCNADFRITADGIEGVGGT